MKKRPYVGIINTLEAGGANVVDDTTAEYWSVMRTSAAADAIFTLLYGKLKRIEWTSSIAENRQVVLVDAHASDKETIVASTRYSIMTTNPNQDYESVPQKQVVHAFTSAATLSGNAATDRSNVYTALAAKINAYAGNNATASLLYVADFTLGTDGAGTATNFTVGETVTQETSTETAVIAKSVISSGTMAGNDAAGKIWFYSVSDPTAWLTTAKTLTGGTSLCVATVTNATTVANTGLAIIDDAGYFTSKIGRGGANYVSLRSGFSTATAEIAEVAAYPLGIGSVMLALATSYDHSKQDLIEGEMDYEFQAGDLPDAAKTYKRYVIQYEHGDEDAMGATVESSIREFILFVDESNNTNLGNFHNAIVAAAAK